MVRLKTRSMSCTSRRQPQMSRRIGGAFFGCPERCENLSAPPGVGGRRRASVALLLDAPPRGCEGGADRLVGQHGDKECSAREQRTFRARICSTAASAALTLRAPSVALRLRVDFRRSFDGNETSAATPSSSSLESASNFSSAALPEEDGRPPPPVGLKASCTSCAVTPRAAPGPSAADDGVSSESRPRRRCGS